MAKTFLDKAGKSYEVIIADDNPELVKEFGISQAPTLVSIKGGEAEKIVNLSNIRKFIENA